MNITCFTVLVIMWSITIGFSTLIISIGSLLIGGCAAPWTSALLTTRKPFTHALEMLFSKHSQNLGTVCHAFLRLPFLLCERLHWMFSSIAVFVNSRLSSISSELSSLSRAIYLFDVGPSALCFQSGNSGGRRHIDNIFIIDTSNTLRFTAGVRLWQDWQRWSRRKLNVWAVMGNEFI